MAIGDLHGDLAATRGALRLGGAIDEHDHWSGGKLVVVQTGDILDRGDDEQAILDLFERLTLEAAKAGGAVHVLNGNHELMNPAGDFRYVTRGGFADFRDVDGLKLTGMDRVPQEARARVAALSPGGPYARLLARHNTVVTVGDTMFVHGGVRPAFVDYGIDKLNREVRCWLEGASGSPSILEDPGSPVWSREYSLAPERCDLLAKALEKSGAVRMVVGHTPQKKGITSACNDTVWRIDVGLAAFYGGPLEVLEIVGDKVRTLRP